MIRRFSIARRPCNKLWPKHFGIHGRYVVDVFALEAITADAMEKL
jgi:hypothetical protein